MLSIKAGWIEGIRQVPVKRFGPRPSGFEISLIVIHCIALPPKHFGGHYVDDIFTGSLDPDAHPYFKDVAPLEVSTHLLSTDLVVSLNTFHSLIGHGMLVVHHTMGIKSAMTTQLVSNLREAMIVNTL